MQNIGPTSETEKHPHSMILPPPCLTVFMECLGSKAVFFRRLAHNFPSDPKKLIHQTTVMWSTVSYSNCDRVCVTVRKTLFLRKFFYLEMEFSEGHWTLDIDTCNISLSPSTKGFFMYELKSRRTFGM